MTDPISALFMVKVKAMLFTIVELICLLHVAYTTSPSLPRLAIAIEILKIIAWWFLYTFYFILLKFNYILWSSGSYLPSITDLVSTVMRSNLLYLLFTFVDKSWILSKSCFLSILILDNINYVFMVTWPLEIYWVYACVCV